MTNFRVPAYVPITLPTLASQQAPGAGGGSGQRRHQLADLVKPILFDCDYDYEPDEDARLTVRWFRNKEPEPFYQWLPELGVRHFADWIKPLLNASFVSDPHDPMKRYRSLLIKRLSMNLTGHYTCLVSSLAGQDMRQASLVVYQTPRAFTFEHRIFSAPAALPGPPPHALARPLGWPAAAAAAAAAAQMPPSPHTGLQQRQPWSGSAPSPTHFKSLGAGPHASAPPTSTSIVRPANNNVSPPEPGKIVYTHDGRPILKPAVANSPKSKRQISEWMLRKRLEQQPQPPQPPPLVPYPAPAFQPFGDNGSGGEEKFAIQLHHIQCQAVQVTPRPIIALLVKRDAESIVQYLHESSSVSIRSQQVNQADYYAAASAENNNNNNSAGVSSRPAPDETSSTAAAAASELSPAPMMITLYDITVSATVALNVSLSSAAGGASASSFPPPLPVPADQRRQPSSSSSSSLAASLWGRQFELTQAPQPPPPPGVATVLPYRRGQRMSFECHLEITGTEFEERKRINIVEQGLYLSLFFYLAFDHLAARSRASPASSYGLTFRPPGRFN